jgi:putative peptidoglycan lipid II flippase
MAAGTTLSRLTGFGRVVALAYVFNFGRLADAYNLANTVPNILYDLVLGGVLSATLVPVFVSWLDGASAGDSGDDQAGWRAVSAVATVATVILAALSLAFVLAAPLVIRLYTLLNDAGSAGPQRAVATTLLRWFAPQVLLLGVIALTTAMLNAARRFAAPAFSPVLNNVIAIAVLLATPHVARSLALGDIRHDSRALALLGLGTTAGYLVQALAQLPALRAAGGHLTWVWDLRHPAVRTVARLSGWTFGFVASNQVALFVVLLVAERSPGGVSAYSAAYLFFQLPHAVLAVSVMSALQPELAANWSAGEVDEFRHRLVQGLRLTAVIVVPAAVGYIVLARPIVVLVLEHGRLTHGAALVTADLLALLAAGLPGFSAYLLLMRAYQAMQDTRTVFWLYLLENGANIVLAFALYPVLGVRGLGLALSLAYAVGTVAALGHLRRRTGGLEGRTLAPVLVRILIATAAMGAVVAVTSAAVGGGTAFRLALRVGAAVVAGAAVYLVVAVALGVDDLAALVRRGTRRR